MVAKRIYRHRSGDKRKSGAKGGLTGGKQHRMTQRRGETVGKPQRAAECRRCGKNHSKDAQGPARNATCFKCNRKGRYGTQCSKTVAEQPSETDEDEAFLFPVRKDQASAWTVDLRLGNKDQPFKVDTGADVTAISDEAHSTLHNY